MHCRWSISEAITEDGVYLYLHWFATIRGTVSQQYQCAQWGCTRHHQLLLITWGVHKAEIIIISNERLICRSHPAAEMVPLVEDVPHTLVVLLPLGLMHNDLTKRRFQSQSTLYTAVATKQAEWLIKRPCPMYRQSRAHQPLQILFYLSMWGLDSTWIMRVKVFHNAVMAPLEPHDMMMSVQVAFVYDCSASSFHYTCCCS